METRAHQLAACALLGQDDGGDSASVGGASLGGASVVTGTGLETRDAVLRGLNVSDGTLALLRKLVRSVPPVETACMEADECISALEAEFQ